MKFIVEKEIFEKLPNACFGVVMAKGIDNSKAYPEIDKLLDESITAAAQRPHRPALRSQQHLPTESVQQPFHGFLSRGADGP